MSLDIKQHLEFTSLSFIRFGEFSAIISSNIFSVPHIFSFWNSDTNVRPFGIVPQVTEVLIFSNSFFLSVVQIVSFLSSFL